MGRPGAWMGEELVRRFLEGVGERGLGGCKAMAKITKGTKLTAGGLPHDMTAEE